MLAAAREAVKINNQVGVTAWMDAAANAGDGDSLFELRPTEQDVGVLPLYRKLANRFGDWGIAWGTGYQIADTQSGQRFYPAEVCALRDIPGEGFVFEAQVLISAARQLGTRVVSVPIESRYQQPNGDEQFRASHFRPLQDLGRITSHVVAQVLRRGGMWQVYRSIRAHPPLIDDPSGEFAPATAAPRAVTR